MKQLSCNSGSASISNVGGVHLFNSNKENDSLRLDLDTFNSDWINYEIIRPKRNETHM
ncbi:hypothetical protein Bca101_025309 [Brassica carinata]